MDKETVIKLALIALRSGQKDVGDVGAWAAIKIAKSILIAADAELVEEHPLYITTDLVEKGLDEKPS